MLVFLHLSRAATMATTKFLQFSAVVCWVLITMSCLKDGKTCTAAAQLTPDFYGSSCPSLQGIVRRGMRAAVANETRMAASILRLFFHDCFVQGCDGSVLLDDTTSMQGEKNAIPNANSLRGFEVVDNIKATVESACPGVVSCADILALAARDAVVLSGGPTWSVALGRRDSTTASYSQANTNLPAPFDDLSTLIKKFQARGLSLEDLVTLSGAHTIGQARCINFRKRLYGSSELDGNGNPDATLSASYLWQLQSLCPSNGSDDNVAMLDVRSPFRFDSCYYTNLMNQRGLLTSDQQLFLFSSTNDSSVTASRLIVQSFSRNTRSFFANFPTSMMAMGNLNALTGTSGQIRTNCRVVNT